MRYLPARLALVALLLGACASPEGSAPAAPPTPAPLLVTVEARGGECPDGMCSTTYDLYRDGRVVRSDGAVDQVDEGTVARLAQLIDGADWDAILARPFTGECPTAYDGQELVYTFRAARGAVMVASCAIQVDPGQEPFETLGLVLFGAPG